MSKKLLARLDTVNLSDVSEEEFRSLLTHIKNQEENIGVIREQLAAHIARISRLEHDLATKNNIINEIAGLSDGSDDMADEVADPDLPPIEARPARFKLKKGGLRSYGSYAPLDRDTEVQGLKEEVKMAKGERDVFYKECQRLAALLEDRNGAK